MRGALAVVSIICALTWSTRADAQEPPKANPKVSEALKLAESGDREKAATMLHDVYESTGDSHALFLAANLFEELGQWEKALLAYETYVSKHSSGKHVEDARTRLESLQARGDETVDPWKTTDPGGASEPQPAAASTDWVGAAPEAANGSQVSVRTDVKGALVMIDGVLVGTTLGRRTPVTESVSSGVHAVSIHRHGRAPWGAHLRASDGETLQLDLKLGREQSRGAKLAAWSVGGIGAASVLAGVGIGVGALLDEDQNLAESADVMILGGLTAIATGVVIHWVTRSKPTEVKLRKAR